MTETGYLIWFIATAVLTTAILTVGTLAAADLLHRPRGADHSRVATSPRSVPERNASGDDKVLGALAPLGSSLSAGSQLPVAAQPESRPGRQRPAA